jgi:hypothetical protein
VSAGFTLHVTVVSAEGAVAAAETARGVAAAEAEAAIGVPRRRARAARRERRRRTGEVIAWDMGVAFVRREVPPGPRSTGHGPGG